MSKSRKTITLPPHARAAEEEQMRVDREFFENNPGAGVYVRSWIPGEFWPEDLRVEKTRFTDKYFVQVGEIEPGVRSRMPLFDVRSISQVLRSKT